VRTGFFFLTAAVLLATGPGCGGEWPPLATATGKVTFKNEPLTAGSVTFHPDAGNEYLKDKPSSLLQADGSFAMQTFPFGPGVPPGKYKVTLTPELAKRIKRPTYADPAKTPWAVDVPDGGLTDQVFEVK
jgi:hypothetical protein